jgi:hypothetical protein
METLLRMLGIGDPPADPPTQSAPVAHDDYQDYRGWAGDALTHASCASDPQWIANTLDQWQQLPRKVQASFALAVRELKQAERTFTEATAKLDTTVEEALDRTSRRMSRKATDRLYHDLNEQLKARLAPATTAARLLEELLDVHQYEEFEEDMWKLVEYKCEKFRFDRDAAAYWLQESEDLRSNRQNNSSVSGAGVNIAQELANIVNDGYEAPDTEDVEDQESDQESDQHSDQQQPDQQPD